MAKQDESSASDPRFNEIIAQLDAFSKGDFTHRLTEGTGTAGSISGRLNALAEQISSARSSRIANDKRVETLLEALLRYTRMDFSEKLEVSELGDEIDAIAMGLNTLADELAASQRESEAHLRAMKESRDQFDRILQHAPSAVVVIDAAGTILFWNAKAESVFGWSSHEVSGKAMHELIMPPRYRAQHLAGLSHFLKSGEGPILNRPIEVAALRKGGEEFPIELAITATRSHGQHIFVAFITDISVRKRNESRLVQANRELELSNDELEAFSYSVSHDLRAPLRAIGTYAQLLADRYSCDLPEKAKTFVQSIVKNTHRMNRLIEDLLALARLGRSPLTRSLVDMNDLVGQVLADMEKGPVKGPSIRVFQMPPATADRNLLVQVYTNLLSNAIKYTSKKEDPSIEVGALEKQGEVVYYVKDNGSGFDMTYYDKLFGVFQRLHDATEFEGTGVGLAIVQRIIKKHGGRIWAEAEVGKGATFYFTLDPSS